MARDGGQKGGPSGKVAHFSNSHHPFWHQGLVMWKTIFPRMGVGGGWGWFQDDSRALHLLCTLLPLLLHQFHLRSSTTRSQWLGTPDLDITSFVLTLNLISSEFFYVTRTSSNSCILLSSSLYIFMMEIIFSNPN